MAQTAVTRLIQGGFLVHHPQQPIAWHRGKALCAEHFLQDVSRLAAQLPESHHVFNLCEDRYHFLVSFAAAILRNQITLMPSNSTPGAVNTLLQDRPDSYCLCDQEIPGIQAPQYLFETLIQESQAAIPLPREIPRKQRVAVLFTSGSTGKPKPNPKTWGELQCEADSALRHFPFLARGISSIVATVPAQHMYGLATSVLFPWQGGLAVHTGRPLFPADIASDLALTAAPRVLITTPLHLRACLDSDVIWPDIDFVISATAPLSQELAAEAEHQLRTEIYEIYGSTETGSIASRRTVQEQTWHLYDGIRIDIEDGSAVAQGGHLFSPIYLNDHIRSLDQHSFLLQGRATDMLKIAGKRVSLGDLNQKLLAIPGVVDGVFVPPADPTAESQRLTALVVAPALGKQDILSTLAQSVDAAFLPRPLYFVDRLPRNDTGKLPRDALIQLLKSLKKTP
jgi:acyl-coenzyme A synthetase/AMP-(fatty) acid ligase